MVSLSIPPEPESYSVLNLTLNVSLLLTKGESEGHNKATRKLNSQVSNQPRPLSLSIGSMPQAKQQIAGLWKPDRFKQTLEEELGSLWKAEGTAWKYVCQKLSTPAPQACLQKAAPSRSYPTPERLRRLPKTISRATVS